MKCRVLRIQDKHSLERGELLTVDKQIKDPYVLTICFNKRTNTGRPEHGNFDTVSQSDRNRHKDIPPTTPREGTKVIQELSAITFQSSREIG